MIVLNAVLLVIIVALIAACSGLYWRAQGNGDRAHAKCVAHIAHYVGDEFAASVLVQAAHDYDSVEEHSRMKVLARLRYQNNGPSMPAIWLLDRADRLRGNAQADMVSYVEATQAD